MHPSDKNVKASVHLIHQTLALHKSFNIDMAAVAYRNVPWNEADSIKEIVQWHAYIHQKLHESAAQSLASNRNTANVNKKIWTAPWNYIVTL